MFKSTQRHHLSSSCRMQLAWLNCKQRCQSAELQLTQATVAVLIAGLVGLSRSGSIPSHCNPQALLPWRHDGQGMIVAVPLDQQRSQPLAAAAAPGPDAAGGGHNGACMQLPCK
jgi:hypothetical protein